MSVPHLDTRVVDGKASLLFGPYAGFSTKYMKTGSYLDLFAALRWHNLFTFIGAGLTNLSLVWYLVTEVLSTKGKRHRALQQFAPRARSKDWHLITAGQRVQIMKRVNGKAMIQFGTEVVSSADGSIAGLLGASPGASTAVPIMLDVIAKCFPDRMAAWERELEKMIPSYGSQLSSNKAEAKSTISRTAKALAISA
jgi:malate dehydrogenase (quinone)